MRSKSFKRQQGAGRLGPPLNIIVGRAQQDERRAHLSAKSSMSKMATRTSECSWKKKLMLLVVRHTADACGALCRRMSLKSRHVCAVRKKSRRCMTPEEHTAELAHQLS